MKTLLTTDFGGGSRQKGNSTMSSIEARTLARGTRNAPSPRDWDGELRRLWDIHGGRVGEIARALGRTKGQISGRSRILGLQFHGGRARVLTSVHPAAAKGRSVFAGRVAAPELGMLKSGDNQRKLGRVVTKGDWKGMPIYSLTLEERATCPRTCKQWLSCYGNNMSLAKRYRHGQKFEALLGQDLAALQVRHPFGFVVRVHVLGDFYSAEYVRLWDWALDLFPALHVFGYTAWQPDTEIGREVVRLRSKRWERFAVRTSGAAKGPRTLVIADDEKAPKTAIICPAQAGATTNCASCGLCWSPAAKHRPIAFHQH